MTNRNELATLLLLIAALCFGMALGLMLSQRTPPDAPEPAPCADAVDPAKDNEPENISHLENLREGSA